ncbi:hypothetical protein [Sporomusa malonica]|uniref:Uncharacterized protein n=1 Tax=Sporomusa malonica TaxID=112901 RepID=A0A1W2F1V8_9FIRM|nr:hypothetical protein [Sporomusa malonica]SMD15812.1 hypothetical protein SAMN04488500_1398 [Sporomusa malonica]
MKTSIMVLLIGIFILSSVSAAWAVDTSNWIKLSEVDDLTLYVNEQSIKNQNAIISCVTKMVQKDGSYIMVNYLFQTEKKQMKVTYMKEYDNNNKLLSENKYEDDWEIIDIDSEEIYNRIVSLSKK